MADLFGNNNDNFDLGSAGSSDKLKAEEIQKVIMMEQQKAQLNAQVMYWLYDAINFNQSVIFFRYKKLVKYAGKNV